MEPRWVRVAALSEFGPTRRLVRDVEGVDVLLVRVGHEVLAVRNRCTHLGHALDGGRVMAGQVTCPFHGACFDLRTGAAMSGPAVLPLIRYDTRVVDDRVEVRVDAP